MFSPEISLVNSAIDLNIRIHHRLEYQDTKQKTFFILFFHEKRALDARDVYYVSLWICTGNNSRALLSRQPRVTVMSCFVYKIIRDL